jgi:hypothetical protein
MSDANPFASYFTQVDINPSQAPPRQGDVVTFGDEHAALLRQMLNSVDKQNELMGELVGMMSQMHKQRQQELGNWKQANPELSRCCKKAADALSKVHVEFLDKITEEVSCQFENLLDSEYVFNEFVDKYGPRLAHLNGVMQVLSTLGSGAPVEAAPAEPAS